jgi:hypothetical protein
MEKTNEIMNGNHPIDLDNLINRTQKEDARNRKLMKAVFILYVICTVLYSILLLFNPDPDLTLFHRLGGLCYVAAFLIGAIYFRREYKIYKKLDYTLPLLQLLERTEKRYRFFSRKWIPIIVVVVLIDLGISLTQHARDYPFIKEVADDVLIIQAGYWILMFIAGFLGYLLWKKRSYPIWKDSKTLLKELQD